jgi:hypothetical protein
MFGKIFDNWKEGRQKKRDEESERKKIKLKMQAFQEHSRQLEQAMEKLFLEHKYIPSFEYAYSLIDLYAHCKDKLDYEYCKKCINKLYERSGDSYDNER